MKSLACFLIMCALTVSLHAGAFSIDNETGTATFSVSGDGRRAEVIYEANGIHMPYDFRGGTFAGTYMIDPDGKLIHGRLVNGEMIDDSIRLTYEILGVQMTRVIRSHGEWFHVVDEFQADATFDLRRWVSTFQANYVADWTHVPCVGGFFPDAYYKSPIVAAGRDGTGIAVVPDVEVLGERELLISNHAMEYGLGGKAWISVGFVPAKLAGHSFYQPDHSRTFVPRQGMKNGFFVWVGQLGERPMDRFNTFLWNEFGRDEQAVAAQGQQGKFPAFRDCGPFDQWRTRIWEEIGMSERWIEHEFPGHGYGAAVGQYRWGAFIPDERKLEMFGSTRNPFSYSFTSWFNGMRTATGMALHFRNQGDAEALEKTASVINVLLAAPGTDGAFKCYAAKLDDGSIKWAAGDGKLFPTEEGFLGFDMAWTGYWMLRWLQYDLPNSGGILERTKALGDFFVKHQQPNGMVPSVYHDDGTPNLEQADQRIAETAPIGLFLSELATVTGDDKYWNAAKAAMDFVATEVVPERKWYDYETFYSCAPNWPDHSKAGGHPRKAPDLACKVSGRYPVNNLTMSHAAQAYLNLYRKTGEARYLELGEAVLGYLLSFQQMWTNPVLGQFGRQGTLVGGFTTQNSDAEWSDARQSQISNVLLDFYRETGKAEYLERGIAGIRAQFPVNPIENIAHTGYLGRLHDTGFHWGLGSGMAGFEFDAEFLGDVVLDARAETVVGVNGIDVTSADFGDSEIQLEMETPFAIDAERILRITADEGSPRTVVVNGTQVGSTKDDELTIPSRLIRRAGADSLLK